MFELDIRYAGDMTVYEYLMVVLENFDKYLKQMRKGATRKEEQIWYDSRIKFLKRFKEDEIDDLRRLLQNKIDVEFINHKNKQNMKALDKMSKDKELMGRLD